MQIIIDSNILFSAMIKDSITRKIMLEYDGLFLFPEYIFKEVNRHKEELYSKSGMNPTDFNALLQLILDKVELVPENTLIPYGRKTKELVKDIDPDDAPFIACALAYPNSILWSNDGRLKRIKEIKVIDTKELMKAGGFNGKK